MSSAQISRLKRIAKLPWHWLLFLNWTLKAGHLSFWQKASVYASVFSLLVKAAFEQPKNRSVSHTMLGIDIQSYSYRHLLFLVQEIFVQGVYEFQAKTITPVIFDCGSNIGVSILFFKWRYPNAKIEAFEPNPHCLGLLEKNLKRNEISGVTIHPVALSDTEESTSFHYEADNPVSLTAKLAHIEKSDSLTSIELKVQTLKLSGYLKNKQVDLLKIDVEGSELQILNDLATQGCLKQIDRCFIEYHGFTHPGESRFCHFLETLRGEGFQCKWKSVHFKNNRKQDVLVYATRN